LPFKSLESFKIDEPCLRRWAEDLNPSTARTYVFYLLRYVEWVKEKKYWSSAQEMLDDYAKLDERAQYRHLDILRDYIKSKETGTNDKRNNLFAVRNFYGYHHLSLPSLSRQETSRLLRLSETDKRRAMEMAPLKLDEARQLIMNLQNPYRTAVMVMLQSAMGSAEFVQFNQKAWRNVAGHLKDKGPVKVELYRSKISRTSVKKYYTFIGEDAKTLLSQWSKSRPRSEGVEELFLSLNKNKGKLVPLSSDLIGKAITKAAKKGGLVTEDKLGRYHVHAHELRDLFKSLCTLRGVNQVASEFFLGHTVDKLGYDKSPEYDEEWFRNEYRKVEPLLNVLSNPKGFKTEEDVSTALKRQLLLVAGYSKQEVEKMNLENVTDEDLTNEIRKRLLGTMANNGNPQRIIPQSEIEKYLNQGWEYVTALPNDRAIVKIPL
jgi:hypothetical protein